jgi:hypothetical protein
MVDLPHMVYFKSLLVGLIIFLVFVVDSMAS